MTDFHACFAALQEIIRLADDASNLTEIKEVANGILADAGVAERAAYDDVPSDLKPFKGKQLLVARVPLEIVFSEEDVELADSDRENEPKATDEQVRDYIGGPAIVCDFNTEDHDQLTGAAIQSISLKLALLKLYRL